MHSILIVKNAEYRFCKSEEVFVFVNDGFVCVF